jgi:hypothetical protein
MVWDDIFGDNSKNDDNEQKDDDDGI